MSAFRVVIAGRPNVGKSALFNRLLRRRRSLVHDLPGMTRDILEVEAPLSDGRTYRLLDTGGYDPEGKEKIPAEIRDRAVQAIRRADLVLLVMDASAGVLPGDLAAAQAVRGTGVETLVVANKVDRREGSEGEVEAWELGFAEVYGVSAEHAIGIDELIDAIASRVPAEPEAAEAPPEATQAEAPREAREIALAIIGRPNVGKSSLVNALTGEDLAIVSEVAGTTRDATDVSLEAGGNRFRLVDTAGIRRKAKTEQGPEVLSVVQARKRVEECDVALLVLDAFDGPTAQDASVAAFAHEQGKGLVIVANKWDLSEGLGPEASRAVRGRGPRAAPVRRLRRNAPRLREDGQGNPARSAGRRSRRGKPPAPDHDGGVEPGPRSRAPGLAPSHRPRHAIARLLRRPDGRGPSHVHARVQPGGAAPLLREPADREPPAEGGGLRRFAPSGLGALAIEGAQDVGHQGRRTTADVESPGYKVEGAAIE